MPLFGVNFYRIQIDFEMKWYALASALLTWPLISFGALVRLHGAGLSCPDWPLCYGMIFPTPDKIQSLGNIEYTYFQIFLEWIHRANAAFIIGPTCVVFSSYLLLKMLTADFL